MQAVFLIIISVAGTIYALMTRQGKTAFGFLIIGLSFVFSIPNLVSGIWIDVFGAISMIVFLLGVLVVVFKPKEKSVEESVNKEE